MRIPSHKGPTHTNPYHTLPFPCSFFQSVFHCSVLQAAYAFRTGFTYTFDFYQHLFLPLDFKLVFPVAGAFDLVRHLNGQPIHFMAKTAAGEYLWNFELWHERLLEAQTT